MRFALIDLLVFASVCGLGYVVWKAYLRRKAQSKLTKVAYFSGGPLNGTEEKLAKLPQEYLYTYDKPQMVKLVEGGKPEPVKTWFNAIYDHVGDGNYEYQGSVAAYPPPHYE